MRRLLLFGSIVAQCQIVFAQAIPNLINYQGRLTDSSGVALPAGSYGIEFRLWDSVSNDAGLVWGQRGDVRLLANGVFNVILGAPGGSPIPEATPAVNDLSFAFAASNRFLGLTVVSSNGISITDPSEILPRQQLLSVPFAMMSRQVLDGAIGSNQLSSQSVSERHLTQHAMDLLSPPGAVLAYADNHLPEGWLLCDGQAVSRTTYSNLWQAIGTTWGQGDGSSTFNLPDLRGLFLRGKDYTAGRDPDKGGRTQSAPGGNSGNAVGSVQTDGMATHTHGINDNFGSSHVIGAGRKYAEGETIAPDLHPTTSQSANIGNTETRPKNAYVNYIIKY